MKTKTHFIVVLVFALVAASLSSCKNAGPMKEITLLIFLDEAGNPVQATNIAYNVVESSGPGGKMTGGKTDKSGIYRSGVTRYQSALDHVENITFDACGQSFTLSKSLFHGLYPDPKSIVDMVATLSAKNIPTGILKGVQKGLTGLLSTEKVLWIAIGRVTVDCESGTAVLDDPS